MRKSFITLLSATLLFTSIQENSKADDWPQWRGPNRDGISTETGLLGTWPEAGPTVIWKAGGLGGGYSSPAIVGGKIFGTGYSNGEESVWALSLTDGKEIWKRSFAKVAEKYGDIEYSEGPRATPTVDGDFLYVLGAAGHLACVETADGKVLWTKNLVSDFGGEVMSDWGYAEAPLIEGDKILCTPGGKDGTVVALDRKTGSLIWQSNDLQDPAAYSSLVAAEIAGKKQAVVLTGASVAGIDVENGKVLWQIARKGKIAVVPTPIIHEDHVWVTSGYGVGSHQYKISASDGKFTAEEVYATRKLKNEFGGAIRVGDYVYASSGVAFICMDFKTGKVLSKSRSIGGGGLLYADGRFYLRNDRGTLALIEADQENYTEKGKFEQSDRSENKTWPTPVIVDGRLYLRDQGTLLCYDIEKK